MKSQISQIFSGVFFRDQEKRRADGHWPEERLCRRAITADVVANADDFSGAKIMLGMKKFFHGAVALAMAGLFALVFSQALHAQTVTFQPGETSNWNCDTLYGGADVERVVSRYIDPTVNAATQRIFSASGGTGWQNTLALGPWLNEADPTDPDNGKLVMYMWYCCAANRPVYGLFEGETVPRLIMTNTFGTSAGGEVNQLTGEIYFSGAQGDYVGRHGGTALADRGDFQLRLCDPVTGTCRKSSEVRPVEGTWGNDSPSTGQRTTSSDMSIDAEGNAYILIGTAHQDKKLIRIVPGADGAVWYYNIVKVFPTFGANTATTDMWGMAFLNGSLFTFGDSGNPLKQVNPLSGTVIDKGDTTPYQLDLTSCQVAPVVHGKIYNDANGDGVISSAEEAADGVSNVLVEIWEDNGSGNVVWQGDQRTSSLGEYSFIVGSTSATYYVKLKQPKINGVNAYQTWASANAGDPSAQNKVTAYCTDGTTSAGSANDSAVTASAQCKGGAHFRGSDAGTLDPSGTTSLSDFMARSNFFSKVVMSTDKEVAIADFALTGRANHNDALQTYGDALHVTPAPANYWLGDTVTTQDGAQYHASAAAIVSHDGIEVNIPEGSSRWVSLQGASLTSGVAYNLRAKAHQPSGEPGYLSAWVSTGTSFAGTGAVQVSTDQQALTGTSENIGFNYTPTTVSGAPVQTFARARFSSTDGVPATGGQVVETTNSVKPWALEGEVEDYGFYAVKGQLILATSSSEPATFTYTMSNIDTTSPSISSDSLTTTAANTVVYQNSSTLHAFNSLGADIEIYQTPPNSDWGAPSGVVCTDNTGANMLVSWGGGNEVVIPGSRIQQGVTITCVFTNTKGADPTNSSIEISPAGPLAADGVQAYTVKAILRNTANQPVSSTAVLFDASNGDITPSTATCTTDSSGECTVSWSSTVEGTFTITAVAAASPFGNETRTFVKYTVGAGGTTITANPTSISISGGTATDTTSTITVQLKNSAGINVPQPGVLIDLGFDGNDRGASLSATQCTTNAGGSCTVTLTSGTTIGNVTIKGRIGADDIADNAVVEITSGGISHDRYGTSLRVAPEKVYVGGGAQSATINVTLRDHLGHIVAAPAGGAVVNLSNVSGCGTLGIAGGTIAEGSASFTTTISSSMPCVASVTATVDGQSIENYGEDDQGAAKTAGVVTFYSSVIDFAQSDLTVWPGVVAADGTSHAIATVQLRDASGVAVGRSGVAVRIENSGAVGVFPGNTAAIDGLTDASGKFEARITSTTAGQALLAATVSGQSVGATVGVIFVEGSTLPNGATLSAYPTANVEPVSGYSLVTVQLTLNGVPYARGTGISVVASASGGSTFSFADGGFGVTNGTGTYTTQLTSTADGTATVTAQGTGFSTTYPTSVQVTFAGSPQPPVDRSLAGTTVTANPVATLVGTQSTVTVQLRNVGGQAMAQQGVVVALSTPSSGASVVGSNVQSTDQYGRAVFQVTSSTAGLATFSANVDGTAAENSASVLFYQPTVNWTASTIAADPASLGVGENSTVTVTLRDSQGLEVLAGSATGVSFSKENNGDIGDFVGAPSCTIAVGASSCSVTYSSTASGSVDVHAMVGTERVGGATGAATITFGAGGVDFGANGTKIEASPTNLVVGNNTTVTLTLRDANGNTTNAPSDMTATFTLAGSPNVGSFVGSNNTCTVTTGNSTCTVQVTSTTTGQAEVRATIGSNNVQNGSPATATFTAGEVSFGANGTKIEASPTSLSVGGNSTITLTLQDQYGNLATSTANQTATFTLNSSSGYVGSFVGSNTCTVTAGNSTCTVQVTSTTPGQAEVTAAIGSNSIQNGAPATVTFTAGDVSFGANGTKIEASPTSLSVGGNSTITVTLLDELGNLATTLSAMTVNFTNEGDGTFVGVGGDTCTIPADGSTCSVQVTSATPGTARVKAAIGSNNIQNGSPATVVFNVGNIDYTVSTITANPTSITADGNSTSTITVQLKDNLGNNVTVAQQVTFTTDKGSFQGGTNSCTTNASTGSCTVTLVSSTSVETATVGATGGFTDTATVAFTLGDADFGPNGTSLRIVPASIAADNNETAQIIVQLRDAFGRPVTGSGETITITAQAGSTAHTLGVATGPVDGTGRFTTTVKSATPGSATFAATVGSNQIQNQPTATVAFIGETVDFGAKGSSLTAVPANVEADGVAYALITVQARDEGGNPIGRSGLAVTITKESGPGQFGGSNDATITGTTDASGKFTTQLTSATAGEAILKATLSGAAIANGSPASVTFATQTVSTGTAGSTLAAEPRLVQADGISASVVTVQLRDASGNPIAKQASVTISTTLGSLVGSLGGGGQIYTAQTDPTGKLTVTLTSAAEGTATVTASVAGNPVSNPASVQVTFESAPEVDASYIGTTIEAMPLSVEANGQSSAVVTLQLRDVGGNAVAMRNVLVAFSSTLGALAQGSGTTDAQGRYQTTITSTTAGTATITAQVDGSSIEGQARVKFTKNTPSFATTGTSISANPVSLQVGGVSTVTVTLRDENGIEVINTASGLSVVFANTGIGNFVANTNTCAIATNQSSCSVQVTSTGSGDAVVTAMIGSDDVQNGSPATITFGAGGVDFGANGTKIEASPTSLVVGNNTTVTLTLRDANGNTTTAPSNMTATFTLAGSPNVGSFVGGSTCTVTTGNSTCTVQVTSTTTGQASVTAVVESNNVQNGSPATATFTAGEVSFGENGTKIEASPTSLSVGGNSTITLTLQDQYGNLATSTANQTATFTLNSSSGYVGSFVGGNTCTVTAGNSTCTVQVTSTTPGPAEVGATIGSNSIQNGAPATVTFSEGAYSAGNTLITANPTAISVGSGTSTITAQLRDAHNNNVSTSGVQVSFAITNNGGANDAVLSPAACTTGSSGSCTVTLASGNLTGTVTIGANVETMPTNTVNVVIQGDSSKSLVTVTKTVTGAGKAMGYVAGGKFAITVDCGAGQSQTFNLADTEVDTMLVTNGAVCTVTEAAPTTGVINGGFTNLYKISPSEFTVVSDQAVSVTNEVVSGTVTKGTLEVEKIVTGDPTAIAASGHADTTNFAIAVTCGTTTTNLSLKENQKALIEGAAETQCLISETVPTLSNPAYKYVASFSPQTATLASGLIKKAVVDNKVMTSTTTTVNVTLTNSVTGDKTASGYDATGTFGVTLNCGTTNSWPTALLEGDVGSYNVPTGSSCALTTASQPSLSNASYSWVQTLYTPSASFTANAATAAIADHWIDLAASKKITVTKTVTGAGKAMGYIAGGKFAITVDCGTSQPPLNLADGESADMYVPLGSVCTVTEAAPTTGVINGGFTNLASISPASFTVSGDQAVSVSNLIESGTVAKEWMTVEKTIGGQTAQHIAGNEFGITVACDTTNHPEFKLKGGQSARLEVPVGKTCSIDETTVPTSGAGYIYLKMIEPSQVAVAAGTEETVTVTNTVVPNTVVPRDISLTNLLAGIAPATAGYNETQSFAGTITCTGDSGVSYATNLKRGIKGVYQVGQGDTCVVATLTRPSLGSSYSWYGLPAYNPTSPIATGTTAVDMTATHTIGSTIANVPITVTKVVSGNTNTNWPATFKITVDCGSGNVSGSAAVFNLADGASDTHHAASGSTCTVTEDSTSIPTNPGYAYRTIITSVPGGQMAGTSQTFTLGTTDPNVTVANTSERNSGNERLKAMVRVGGISAEEAAKFAGVEFLVNVQCQNRGVDGALQPASYNATGKVTGLGYVSFDLNDAVDDGATTTNGEVPANALCYARLQDASGTALTPTVAGYTSYVVIAAPLVGVPAVPKASGGDPQMTRKVILNVQPR